MSAHRDDGPEATAPILQSIYFYPTGKCNLRCRHCWVNPDQYAGAPAAREALEGAEGITAGELEKVLDEAGEAGLGRVKITGGEPFLRSDLLDLIALMRRRGLSVDIESNGTLIDEVQAASLADLGVTQVAVSLDGARADTHDSFRGVRGSYGQALAGIARLVDAGVPVQVIYSLHRRNAAEMEETIALARRMGAGSVKVNPVTPLGRGERLHRENHSLSVPELLNLSRALESREWSDGFQLFFTVPTAFKSVTGLSRGDNAECGILNILGLLANGAFSICGVGMEHPELLMGSCRERSVLDVWRNDAILRKLRRGLPGRLSGVCGRCIMRGLCLGSCRAVAFALSGDLWAEDWFCREALDRGLFPESRLAPA